jgi:hypothetical protein
MTRCWRNVPATVTVPVIELDIERECIVQSAIARADAERAHLYHSNAAIDDLRQQLAEARAERDRYVARCGELEARLEEVRRVVK